MTLSNIVALFGAMLVLAALPSLSVLTVVTRAISSGFLHGCLTAVGIVVGDIVFILVAIYGLSMIADTGGLFVVVKYLGGAYLIWLGVSLWRLPAQAMEIETVQKSSGISSFLAGLLLTLGDQKAILFYMGFLPAFVDLSALSLGDTGLIIAIATLTVGGVKLGYAYMADRARFLFQNQRTRQFINRMAGSVMVLTGVYLCLRP